MGYWPRKTRSSNQTWFSMSLFLIVNLKYFNEYMYWFICVSTYLFQWLSPTKGISSRWQNNSPKEQEHLICDKQMLSALPVLISVLILHFRIWIRRETEVLCREMAEWGSNPGLLSPDATAGSVGRSGNLGKDPSSGFMIPGGWRRTVACSTTTLTGF